MDVRFLLASALFSAVLAMPAGVRADDTPQAPPSKKEITKEVIAIASGLVALLGTAVPLIAKAFDSLSLAARRRKELQRIDDLTSLMEKVKKENILSADTQAAAELEIEQEIRSVLGQFSKSRERYEKARQASEQAQAASAARALSDLPLWRRIGLLYVPHGVGAWIAHGIAGLYLLVGLTALRPPIDSDLLFGSLIIAAAAWVGAWISRSRWQKAQRLAAQQADAALARPDAVAQVLS